MSQSTPPAPERFEVAMVDARRRLHLSGAVPAVVAGAVVGLLVSWWAGGAVALVVLAAWVLWVRSALGSALDRVVAATGARPVEPDELPSLWNALDGVSVLSGVALPEVHLLDAEVANASCVADADRAAVVLTAGLLRDARVVELEVIAAELLCRVRDGSARLATAAAGLPPLLAAVAGLSEAGVAAVMGDHRSVRADLDAVSITRYPPALIAVLDRMASRGTAPAGIGPRVAPLWLAPVTGPSDATGTSDATDEAGPASLGAGQQPLSHRIAVLREL